MGKNTFMRWICLVIAAGAVFAPGCASAMSENRRAYILAHPHGWIEVEVTDQNVPKARPTKEDPNPTHPPTYCRIEIDIDKEPFLGEQVYPFGPAEPFRVESGFRFPVPIGAAQLELSYSGCDGLPDDAAPLKASIPVIVYQEMVTPVHFDGTTAMTGSVYEDTVVTLEKIYNRLQQGRP